MTPPPERRVPRFVPSGRIIDVEASGLHARLDRFRQHMRGGLRETALFLLLFCGVTAGYLLVNIAIVLAVLWWR